MKKLYTILFLTLICFCLFGQKITIRKSGIWVFLGENVTSWDNNDTILFNLKGDTTWAYTDWQAEDDGGIRNSRDCPYKNPTYRVYQERISPIGVVQTRYKIYKYVYIDNNKTQFQVEMDSLKMLK